MGNLPTGTVTFLFTDIEGSTDLLRAVGTDYAGLLERHNELLRKAFAQHDGIEVATEGDSFFVVFTKPTAAVLAAIDAQRAMHGEAWGQVGPVRVRMGLHTGEAAIGGDNYVGLDVHRASRIASAGHGGQVLISDATRALVEHALPAGTWLQDLGRHRLKGLPAPERIFQVTSDGIPSSFPPLRSLEERRHNLPAEMTSFVGREQDVSEIRQRLPSTRLLTLTGPGGTGKTRLAIRVAQEVIGDYEDGCWFVALDALRDPELVPPTIADALGVNVTGDRPVMAALESWLAERELLLVVDNFEQVHAAAPYVAHLLRSVTRLHAIATSRAPLHVSGEQEYPVPPLVTTTDGAGVTAEALLQSDAARLFVERALAVKPDFRVTNENAAAVAQICARLDGLPLAIELAAARVKLLAPEQLLARLQRSLSLLESSAQDLPERQRTLLGAIRWSHDLLAQAEQRLFARLSIFRGGFGLDEAEQVCGDGALAVPVFDGLASLVDKSLLRSAELTAEARFTMLETVRQFARERLAESGEQEALAARHAACYFRLATEAEHHLAGPDQLAWLDRLAREHDNLRAAFEREADAGLLDEALSAAGAIWRFWQLRGHFAEARSLFDRLLARPVPDARARAKALSGAGGIAYWQGDYAAMAGYYREARELYESIGDKAHLADAIYNESYVPVLLHGDFTSARDLIARALDLHREVGNQLGAAEAEAMLGFTHYFEGDAEAAVGFLEKAVATYRAAGGTWQVSDNLLGLGQMYAQTGDWGSALRSIRESIALADQMGIEVVLTMAFESVGAAAAWLGDLERAARLLGKADEMKHRLGGAAPRQLLQTDIQRDKAREELGDSRYAELSAQGAKLSVADAIALANQFEPPADAAPMARARPWGTASND